MNNKELTSIRDHFLSVQSEVHFANLNAATIMLALRKAREEIDRLNAIVARMSSTDEPIFP